MNRVFVHPRVMQRHLELSETDVLEAGGCLRAVGSATGVEHERRRGPRTRRAQLTVCHRVQS